MKLTEEQILEARVLWDTAPNKSKLARQFGLDTGNQLRYQIFPEYRQQVKEAAKRSKQKIQEEQNGDRLAQGD